MIPQKDSDPDKKDLNPSAEINASAGWIRWPSNDG
jgi:hypothetical protein